MNDSDAGKRMVEEVVLHQILGAFLHITARQHTEERDNGGVQQVEGSPDFIIGVDGQPSGIELTEVRAAQDTEEYLAEASRLAWQKN
jgi:hypothetical protein